MTLIIDGYNLLHVTGIFGRGVGPGGLERSRNALLNVLAESLSPEELQNAVVVFDAAEAPPGLPRKTQHPSGMVVHYSSEYADADEMIEELIAQHHAPRSLVVVSSDHRLHRAARRRKATPIDSDRWYGELLRQRSQRGRIDPENCAKPEGQISEAETQFWLEKFGYGPMP